MRRWRKERIIMGCCHTGDRHCYICSGGREPDDPYYNRPQEEKEGAVFISRKLAFAKQLGCPNDCIYTDTDKCDDCYIGEPSNYRSKNDD